MYSILIFKRFLFLLYFCGYLIMLLCGFFILAFWVVPWGGHLPPPQYDETNVCTTFGTKVVGAESPNFLGTNVPSTRSVVCFVLVFYVDTTFVPKVVGGTICHVSHASHNFCLAKVVGGSNLDTLVYSMHSIIKDKKAKPSA